MSDEALGAGIIKPEPSALITARAADIEPLEISWLWWQRIALGKACLVAGDPGLGKSLMTTDMAARISVGGPWPVDGTPAPLGSVLIVSAEDDAADTIVPRLLAAGADLTRVHILECVRDFDTHGNAQLRELSLEDDIALIEARVAEIGDCRLVIVDPISAYMGRVDTHRNSEVRGVLAPLTKLAQRLGVALVIVTHLNKATGTNANYRVTGSIAFTAAVRSSLLVTKDREDPTRRLVLPGKNNLGPDSIGGLAYRVAQSAAGTPYIELEPDPIMISADEALEPLSEEQATARDDAKSFLRDALANGPVLVKELQKQSKAAGIAWRTMERAKSELGCHAGKRQFAAGWFWSATPLRTPPDSPSPPMLSKDKTVAVFDGDGGLRQNQQVTGGFQGSDSTNTAEDRQDRHTAMGREPGGLGEKTTWNYKI
jgi:putative DNA primase/helicase